MSNTLVIVHSDGQTCALLNGKYIAPGIEKISFSAEGCGQAVLDLGKVDLNRAEFGTMEDFQNAASLLGFDIRKN